MKIIRTASFSDLFFTTFLVAGSAQVVMTLFSVLLAFLYPSTFNMNGAPAASAAGALAVVVIFVIVGLMMNAAMSAMGALAVLAWRGLLPRPTPDRGSDVT